MVIEEETETSANRIDQQKVQVNLKIAIMNNTELESVLTVTVLAFSSKRIKRSICARMKFYLRGAFILENKT